MTGMYVPPPYLEQRREVLLDAIRARSFGTLVTAGIDGIRLSHLPFVVTGPPGAEMLVAHLARSNPQWRDIGPDTQAVASFLVEDGYISPSWYPSKAETGRVVPTWNYVAVEARGPVELVETQPDLRALVDLVTDQHERERTAPWSTADAPANYTAALLHGIVGIRFHPRELTGAWKLDQQKRAGDREGAAEALAKDARTRDLAARMRSC